MPIRDPLLRQIEHGLDQPLIGDEFEAAMVSMLREQGIYPKLVPVRGGGDAGMDGAIGDPADSAPPIPLVCTTQEDVKANLLLSLASYKGKIGARTTVVSATSRKLTPSEQRTLSKAASDAGFTLLNIYERTAVAELLYRSPRWCRDLLGITTSRPALSAYPQDHRPFIDQPLRGRENDLSWLGACTGDALLVGQPGIGKTFVLRHYAKGTDGLFAVTDDVDAIDAAIREEHPKAIVVADAHARLTLIKSLRQLRQDTAGTWKIIADCWPGGEPEVRESLGVATSEVRELRPLARDMVVEIIHDAGLGGPIELIREIVDQARGRAGLAVTLAWLSLRGDVQHVGLGRVLVQQAETMLKALVGAEALDVLAMLAIGGTGGLALTDVAAVLHQSAAHVQRIIIQLAAGGVVEEVTDYDGDRRIVVQPEALREALVKDRFFGKFPMPAPEQLLTAARPDAVTEVLLGAAHRGGRVPDDFLWRRLLDHGTSELFRSYVALGEIQACRALAERPDMLIHVAPIGLRRAPDEFLRVLLTAAIGDNRETAPNPGHPLRLIQDWVQGGRPGGDAIPRRRRLVDAVEAWLRKGGDPNTAARAVSLALVPTFATSSLDPGAGMTVTLTQGFIDIEELGGMSTLWKRVIDFVPMDRVADWQPVLAAIREFASPHAFGGSPDDVFLARSRQLVGEVMLQLGAKASMHAGILAELGEIADWVGITIAPEIPSDFITLYPRDDWKDYDAWWKAAAEAARQVAARFAEEPPAEIAHLVARYRTQAEAVGRRSGVLNEFGESLAEKVQNPQEWFDALIETGAGHELIAPLLRRLHRDDPAQWVAACRQCLGNVNLRATAAAQVLIRSETDKDLFEQVLGLLSEFTQLVHMLCLRGEIETPTLRRLLTYKDDGVAAAAAVGAWQSEPRAEIQPDLRGVWRAALLRCGARQQRQGRSLFVRDILGSDPSLAFDWLIARVRDGTPFFELADYDLKGAIPTLSADQRVALLVAMAARDTYVPDNLPPAIVGGDIDVYRRLLSDATARRLHLMPLKGRPSETWSRMAAAALDAGYSAEDVLDAAGGHMCSFGGEASEYWDGWRKAWENVQHLDDPRVQEVARLGIERTTRRRDRELQDEEDEAIYGR
ncbi:MAG: hypothetical protein JWO52_462 [Gammaproteobacteria bacterium]|nr:hypothetical protein [Gammaproteobacteria bacterium]